MTGHHPLTLSLGSSHVVACAASLCPCWPRGLAGKHETGQATQKRVGAVQVAGPLLHERDAYLAWCLKRSKAVSGARCVVGVIGFGHLRGVAWHLMQESSQLRFRDLAGLTGTQKETSKEGQLGEALLTGVGIASSIWWVSSLFAHG